MLSVFLKMITMQFLMFYLKLCFFLELFFAIIKCIFYIDKIHFYGLYLQFIKSMITLVVLNCDNSQGKRLTRALKS